MASWTMESADEMVALAKANCEKAEGHLARAGDHSGPSTMAQLTTELAMAQAAVGQALMLRAQVMISLQIMPSPPERRGGSQVAGLPSERQERLRNGLSE
jgi:hypothetical protein